MDIKKNLMMHVLMVKNQSRHQFPLNW